MWVYEKGLWREPEFPVLAIVSTSVAGNLRDAALRASFCHDHAINGAPVTAEQVHGAAVAVVGRREAGQRIAATDGLVTAEQGLPLAIFTADCVPVFLADKQGAAAGVVHAGWRGLAQGIIGVAVRLFKERFAVGPDRLCAAIGPHIQQCCFRIGDEVKAAFGLAADATHLDLSEIACRQLRGNGVTAVSINGHCTCHETDMFYSYRRDKTASRIMSLVEIVRG